MANNPKPQPRRAPDEVRSIQQAIATLMQVRHRSAPGPKEMAVWMGTLTNYPSTAILHAMGLHTRRAKNAPTPADIVEILDAMDTRPSPQEAWAYCQAAENESMTIVWTQEMAQAWGVAFPLIQEGDRVAARMTFLEQYRILVDWARERHAPAHWMPSFGRDPAQREGAIRQAIEQGKLHAESAERLLPGGPSSGELRTLALAAPDEKTRASFRKLAQKFLPQIRERLDRVRTAPADEPEPLPDGEAEPQAAGPRP